jgi:large subunit ribosomal protein L3
MGHRKQSAPRRGSMAFLPRKRSGSIIARIRSWPTIEGTQPKPLAFAGYKVGMTQVVTVDNVENSPTKGREIVLPVTVVEAPPLLVIGARVYENGYNGKKIKFETRAQNLPPYLGREIRGIDKMEKTQPPLLSSESILPEDEIRLIVCTQPHLAGIGKRTPEVFEIKVDGAPINERISYASSLVGKELKAEDVFQLGSFADAFGVSKGKGWQGVVKRYGVKIMDRKSNKTRRGIATMGAKSPSNVMFHIPRGGQMGFHNRFMRNLQVMKIGKADEAMNLKGGFMRYGLVKSNYILLRGTIPGPAKRLVKLRISARKEPVKEAPVITHLSLSSQQGV